MQKLRTNDAEFPHDRREGDHFCFAKIWFEQGTATARPSKRVPYSVQQTGGDDRCGRDKNGCDQVMQHAVGHVTLLGWPWIWKGQLRCSWIKVSNAEALFTVQAIGSAHGTGGKAPLCALRR